MDNNTKKTNDNIIEPLVSIIIPVYNGSNYIRQAIDSALKQDYGNIEVIVINDGSIDGTEEICQGYNDKIRYFFKKNGGVSSALNMGIKVMNGKYFSWLSHDDLYNQNKVSSQINELRKYNFNTVYFCGTNGNKIDNQGKIIKMNKKKSVKLYSNKKANSLLHKETFNGCGLLIPRKLLIDINGFKDEYKYMQDFIAWKSILTLGSKYIYIREDLVSTRYHNERQTVRISDLREVERKKYILEELSKEEIITSQYHLRTLSKYSIKYLSFEYINKIITSKNIRLSFFSWISVYYFILYFFIYNLLRRIYRTFIKK